MKGNKGRGWWSGESGAFLAAFTKTKENSFFDAKCWDFVPLMAASPEDPYAWLVPSTPVWDKLAFASPLPRPQAPHAVRAACHRPNEQTERPGPERVQNCSAAGEADFSPPASATTACCSPLPDTHPSCPKETAEWCPVHKRVGGCPLPEQDSVRHSERLRATS